MDDAEDLLYFQVTMRKECPFLQGHFLPTPFPQTPPTSPSSYGEGASIVYWAGIFYTPTHQQESKGLKNPEAVKAKQKRKEEAEKKAQATGRGVQKVPSR